MLVHFNLAKIFSIVAFITASTKLPIMWVIISMTIFTISRCTSHFFYGLTVTGMTMNFLVSTRQFKFRLFLVIKEPYAPVISSVAPITVISQFPLVKIIILVTRSTRFFDFFMGYLATPAPVILETRQIVMLHLTAALIATPIAFMLSVWYYIQPPDRSNKTFMIIISTGLGGLNLLAIY